MNKLKLHVARKRCSCLRYPRHLFLLFKYLKYKFFRTFFYYK
ncbi:hypothetical protein AAJ76_1080006260 [Vairimorpha ceranae]|uniref:Uncharacterized protein n=1 Tax=Vairimorpha ceranae TaxID=40302 RepID=A0A0F9WM69_9MICR|nr:hypothetical protein AAJ76_1080006260 [Vairimorpha ceranae]KKO74163.1 hypothetical protein AAJ76_1080006260 [Vairimorpha ceranae]